jgi:cell division transport system permease protein
MTLITVSLSVLIFSFFFLVFLNLKQVGAQLGTNIRLIIYLDDEIPAAIQPQYIKKITSFNKVEKIVFKTRKDALANLSKQLGSDKDVLTDLKADFLPPSIEIYPRRDLASLTRIKDFSDFLSTLPGARKVQYGREWIERLGYFTQLIRLIVVLSGSLLVLTATFMVSSTIRLTVVSRDTELEILRILGASKGYIQIPLIIEGTLQGILGSGLGLLCLYLLFSYIRDRFTGPGLLSIINFSFLPPPVTAAILISSILLCTLGSIISIRKFLNH